MAMKKMKSLLVATVKGDHQYFGADAVVVYAALEGAAAAGAMMTGPINLDDTFETMTYNLKHIVNYSARH